MNTEQLRVIAYRNEDGVHGMRGISTKKLKLAAVFALVLALAGSPPSLVHPQTLVGDDWTDNLAAFQDAVDATPVGAILDLPSGIYRVNGTVSRVQATAGVNNCIHIRGAGRGTIIKQMSATADTLRVSADATGDYMSGCVIENLVIAYPTGATAGDAVLFERIHRSLIQNVWIAGAGDAAIHIKGGIFNTVVHSGTSTGFDVGFTTTRPKRGLFLDAHPTGNSPSNANTFIGTVWENVTTAPGIAVHIASGQGNTIIGGGMQSSTVGVQLDVNIDEYAFLGVWNEANTIPYIFTGTGGVSYFVGEQENLPANPAGAMFSWTGTSGGNITASGTNFLSPSGVAVDSGIETNRFVPVDAAIRVRRFNLCLSTAPGAGNSSTFTLRKNGSDSAVTVIISGATATCATSTAEANWIATDLVSIKMTHTGTPAAAVARWTIQAQYLSKTP